jgi:diguanylate cyclase (GGDEF)-like protein/PAS domain S-box-containing protein
MTEPFTTRPIDYARDLTRILPSSRKVDRREWWLWALAIAVTLVLTFAIFTFTFPVFDLYRDRIYSLNLREWVRALTALVLLFDVYTIYQQIQLQRVRRQLAERDRLFQLITENAADMIAVIDINGKRVYNSPAYEKVLGYSMAELSTTSPLEQIHPDDRERVSRAAENARTGRSGETLEYRIRHKNGSWRVLESTANPIRNAEGQMGGLVIVNRDITQRKRAEETLAHNAFYDGLTNLPNRTLLLDRVGRALAIARRHPDFNFAILCIDIDGFKVINDSLGHSAGDALLIKIAERLTACLRPADTVSRPAGLPQKELAVGDISLARPGGDEFVVIVEELRDPSNALRIAERIQAKLSSPFDLDGHEIVVTGSIGIALSGNTSTEPEGVLRDAEIAMYRAKNAGRARWEVFDQAMHAGAVRRLQLESDLRKAVEKGEFRVYYQPIVSLQNSRVVGFEALSRWYRPEGMALPAEFMPVANETGVIIAINRELLWQGCRQLLQWQSSFPADPPLFLSVNVTAREFVQPELASQIRQTLQQAGVDPACIALEITETIAMADADTSSAVVTELKKLGVRIDIDDFGTGYSSLSRLQGFPVDTLKVDRAFVSRIDSDRETYEIVRIIIMLAHSLGLHVVGEGIETETQLDLLRKLGCDLGQGYLFSKPANEQAIGELLSANRSAPRSRAVAPGLNA